MATRYCSKKKKSGGILTVLAIIFLVITPLILALMATVERETSTPPDITTAKVLEAGSEGALHQVTESYDLQLKAEKLGSEAADLTPTGSLSTGQIAHILDVDADSTEITDDGKLRATLLTEDGIETNMIVDNGHVRINGCTMKLKQNGGVENVWGGYNSQHETDIVIGNQKRSLEELATIRSIADSVPITTGKYTHANISGSTCGIWGMAFRGYIVIAFIVAAIIWLAYLAFGKKT